MSQSVPSSISHPVNCVKVIIVPVCVCVWGGGGGCGVQGNLEPRLSILDFVS